MGTTFWGGGNGSAGGYTTTGPTIRSGGGYTPVQQANLAAQQAGIKMGTPQAVQWVNNYLNKNGNSGNGGSSSPYQPAPGSTGTYGSTTTNVSGPNGPFSGLGGQLSTNATNVLNAGNNQLNQTYDQGGNIYKSELQKEQNQTNVNEAQRGITMSPYGAGVANQADIGFNSNWQNQLQDRSIKNIQAAEGAMGPATNLYNSSYGSSTQGYNTPESRQSGAEGSGGGSSRGPVSSDGDLPFPTMSDPTMPYTPYTNPNGGGIQSPGPLYQGTTGQGYTGSTGMMTDSGTGYNQIVNPTPEQNSGAMGTYNDATGGDGSAYPLNGPAPIDYNQYYNDYNSSMQNQAIDPQSSVINQQGSDYSKIMNITDDSGAMNYLSSWS